MIQLYIFSRSLALDLKHVGVNKVQCLPVTLPTDKIPITAKPMALVKELEANKSSCFLLYDTITLATS